MKETRVISYENLRNLCIKNDFYTNGDCEEYDNLFRKLDVETLTTKHIFNIAADIKYHSETDYDIESIMYMLAEISHTYFEL